MVMMKNHEARLPLQNIVASAELLAMTDNRPESVTAIRCIRHAVTVLQGQLRDLLTVARVGADTAGQLPTPVETFEFGELVQDVCAGLQDAPNAKGLALEVKLPPYPVTVSADPVRIAQILRNLVENAVRYTNSGHVQILVEAFVSRERVAGSAASAPELRTAEASAARSVEGLVRFVARDIGPGLPPTANDRLKSAAVPFESSNAGSGIGLFVVRDVLQQLGGSVDV